MASGGSGLVTGTILIDDLSVRVSKPIFTTLTADVSGNTFIWNSAPNRTSAVQFAAALGSPTVWTSLITGRASDGLETSYLDSAIHPGKTGFYRVIQE